MERGVWMDKERRDKGIAVTIMETWHRRWDVKSIIYKAKRCEDMKKSYISSRLTEQIFFHSISGCHGKDFLWRCSIPGIFSHNSRLAGKDGRSVSLCCLFTSIRTSTIMLLLIKAYLCI